MYLDPNDRRKKLIHLYVNNKLDQEVDIDPTELAAEFVQSVEQGTEIPQEASIEFAYGWWISDPEGRSASWDEEDWDQIVDGLIAYFIEHPSSREKMWKKVMP